MSESVTVEKRGAIAIVCFNRPDSLNSIDSSIRTGILQAAEDVNGDDSIRVVILTGAGRAFCAGADLAEKMPEGFDVETMLNE